jgi:hypothetical protein
MSTRRGFMLWEVLVALGLLMIFFAATTQLLRLSMQMPYRANQADALASRFDVALTILRQDVWGSSSMTADGKDGRAIRIERADALPVTWKISEDGTLLRTDGEKSDWPEIAAGMRFEIKGPLLLLIEPADAHRQGRRIPLTSAVMLLKQGKR